jgi:hypothetical protein
MAKAASSPPQPQDRSGMPPAGRQLVLLGLLGAVTSAYGMYVEQQKHELKDAYTPLCDSEYFSCSKVRTDTNGPVKRLWTHCVFWPGEGHDE